MSIINKCPRCSSKLTSKKVKGGGIAYLCPNGHGMSISQLLLRKLIPNRGGLRLWMRAINNVNNDGLSCPSCKRAMIKVKHNLQGKAVDLDGCRSCSLLWFDKGEYQLFFNEENMQESSAVETNMTKVQKEVKKSDALIKIKKEQKVEANFDENFEKVFKLRPKPTSIVLGAIDLALFYFILLRGKAVDHSQFKTEVAAIIGSVFIIHAHAILPDFLKHGFIASRYFDENSLRILDFLLYFGSWLQLVAMPFYLLTKL